MLGINIWHIFYKLKKHKSAGSHALFVRSFGAHWRQVKLCRGVSQGTRIFQITGMWSGIPTWQGLIFYNTLVADYLPLFLKVQKNAFCIVFFLFCWFLWHGLVLLHLNAFNLVGKKPIIVASNRDFSSPCCIVIENSSRD